MHLVSYRYGEQARVGALHNEWLIDLNRALRLVLRREHPEHAMELANAHVPPDMTEFLRGRQALNLAREAIDYALEGLGSEAGVEELRSNGAIRPRDSMELLPPVPRPGKILCIGKNYREHAEEFGGEPPKTPEIFTRFPSTLIGPHAPIRLWRETGQWDYEAELAVVIGKAGRRISQVDALEHIAGYACFNDVSARDFQKRIQQWTAGKNFDGSGPMGPTLATADEVGEPETLSIRSVVSGETMQESDTGKMIFGVRYLISHISEFLTLEPGDVICTGTPGGVGAARDPQRFLRDGDTVRVEIERVGVLENPVVAETPAQ